MKVSVLMSVYNANKYIGSSIESILSQSFKSFEFIIIDDNSTDGTIEIIEKYAQKDSRIIFIKNNTNLGLTINLNKALSEAKGEYIARMDADDIAIFNRFEIQTEYLNKNQDIDIVGSYAKDIDEKGIIGKVRKVPLEHSEILSMLLKVNPMIHPSVMMRGNVLKELKYDIRYRVVQDYDLWFRAISRGYKLANIPEVLLHYRINADYHHRKSFKYRKTDYNVRKNGYRLLNIPLYKRSGVLIPIVLAIIPQNVNKKIYKSLKLFDPRN